MDLKSTSAFENPPSGEPSRDIIEAARIILGGDCVGVPTETVYGLAANAYNEEAARKIFEIKNRPFIDPLIVHIFDMQMGFNVAYFNDKALKLAKKFWPGPLTIILKKKDTIPALVSANLDTVAVRMPIHPLMRSLIKEANVPLAAPSANPFGYVSPTKAEHVKAQLGDKIAMILDGGQCVCGLESTIVSLADETSPKLLRHGPISKEEIELFLGEELVVPKKNPAHPIAPGMLKSHYSPRANFKLFKDSSQIEKDFDGAVIFLKRPSQIKKDYFWLSEDGSLAEIAKNLYDIMRLCDKSYKNILCQSPDRMGIGAAIFDRLERASKK